MSTTNKPPTDQSFNNLSVSGTTALNVAKINNLIVGNMVTSPFSITPSANFVLNNDYSKRIGNIVQLSFSGVLTGNIGSVPVVAGSIPLEFVPSNTVFGISCQSPQGIIVLKVDSTGVIQTCPSGFPFMDPSYDVNINTTYFL